MLLKFALNAAMLVVRVMSNRSLYAIHTAPEARPGLHGRPVALGPPAAPVQPARLSITQLCSRWQLGRKTVYKFIDSRILPAWKVGRHLIVCPFETCCSSRRKMRLAKSSAKLRIQRRRVADRPVKWVVFATIGAVENVKGNANP